MNGVALVDKPEGVSSFAVVAQLRRAFRFAGVRKVGHTGTLDPLASGLLPVCIGEATKFAQRGLDARKTYRATIQFGQATSTGDREGETTAEGPSRVDEAALEAVLPRFRGRITQQPPAFSALKVNGRPAYVFARRGELLELPPRDVEIYALEVERIEREAGRVELYVECSKGTYLRSLAIDLARALGTVGHLAALRRLATGHWSLDQAQPLSWWIEASDEERLGALLPTDTLLRDLPSLSLNEAQVRVLRRGQAVALAAGVPAGLYRAYEPDGGLLGLVEGKGGQLRAKRLLAA
ncbi:MAG: tRNA pseudouridine(55) synthase TruB [Casimicrobiaceae bacterium]|nr:tRNA pseudouridine(55) synthase TruB [Casimicrobiaceae bacterium]MCX8098876.1 tRNA pseudouridine(55) synthase TruB [Casimicrobiaceae bacterium]MDW8312984.1 tRNA pseudouridine(55) synthase TruB [Burkholderiales bacterium]